MPKNRNKRYVTAAAFLIKLIKPHKKIYFAASFIVLLTVFTGLAQARLTQKVIDIAAGSVPGRLLSFLALFLMLAAVNTLLVYLNGVCVSALSSRAGCGLKQKMAAVLIEAEYKEIIKLEAGDTLQKINSDTSIVSSFLENDLTSLFSQLVMALGALVYILCINPLLALITFSFTPIGMFMTLTLNRKMNGLFPLKAENEGRALSLVEQVLSCVPVIKSFMAEKQIRERVGRHYEMVYKADINISKYDALMQPACSMTAMLPRVIYMLAAGLLVLRGDISVGILLSVFDLIGYIIGPTVYFPFILNNLNRSAASIERISRLAALPQAALKQANRSDEPSVKLKKVSFSYEDGRCVLNDFSFEHTGHGIIALCGRSGSGKTSLLDLLAGLYEPAQGTVEVKGTVSVVTQDCYIFNDSPYKNVRLARPEASDIEVRSVLRAAGAEAITKSADLSGGEKQRISLAQTFLKDDDIWLLDEPTSALDAETEKIITQTIKAYSTKKLIIVAAHRPSLISIADRRIEL